MLYSFLPRILFLSLLSGLAFAFAAPEDSPVYCNPLNLDYTVQNPNETGNEALWIREGADPAVVTFGDKYYLFSSMSYSYWVSDNLADWKTLTPSNILNLPILRSYAPTAVVIGDTVYLKDGNGSGPVFSTKTPQDPDSWKQVSENWHKPDAQFFYDDDGKLWIAYGCSNTGYLQIQEIDTQTMMPKGEPTAFFMPDAKNRGWEGSIPGPRGMDHTDSHGWVEGGQLLKHDGTYYFIYSLPGLNNGYANGVYTSKNILGPYTYQEINPVTQKLTGFSPGSSHGEIIKDRYGNFWTFVLSSVWTFDRFERRIGLFPTTIDKNGILLSDTWLGDYPTFVPQKKRESGDSLWNGMNLLTVHRPVKVSSTLVGDPQSIVDEEIMTYWSAASGGANEWVEIDLGSPCLIEAVQANFSESEMKREHVHANIRHVHQEALKKGESATVEDFMASKPNANFEIKADPDAVIRYKVLGSLDGKKWETIIDQSANTRDTPHDFNVVPKPVTARYVRLENVHMPYQGKFALRDLRVFGKGSGQKPAAPEFNVDRKKDRRKMEIVWQPVEGADGYVVRYGPSKDRLYLANQFYKTDRVTISCLDTKPDYFVTVDAFNQSGYTKGTTILPVVPGDLSPNLYEADEAELSGGASLNDSSIGGMHLDDARCAFNVDGGKGGMATMILTYATELANAPLDLAINEETETLTLPGTGSWTEFEPMEMTIKLKAGKENRIEFKSRNQGVNLRSIEIKPTKS